MAHIFRRFRSLLAQSAVWIALPLSLVMLGVIIASVYAYEEAVKLLLIDRDRQLATLSASRVSEALEGYARVLEALAGNPDVLSASGEIRAVALEGAAEALEIFNAGVVIVNRRGKVLTVTPNDASPVEEFVGEADYFMSVERRLLPEFSNVLTHSRTGEDIVIVAVPILDGANQFAGALLGAVQIHDTPLGEPVRKLIVGDEGFAYLVDGVGRVVFHPEAENIGADFSQRPFVKGVISGESGGTVWNAATGERMVIGYAPVKAAGWGLIVREPWEAVVAPTQAYGLLVSVASLGAIVLTGFMLWLGVRRIAVPVRMLATQAAQLASGESIRPIAEVGILEIDSLKQAFSQMAARIESYRAGLRRYVGAVTQSQEEERRRIARELHDETAQGLLGLIRHMELYQAAETDPARMAKFAELQEMVNNVLREVRQISRDLRPLVLEDLGLVSALHTLIRGLEEDCHNQPRINLEVIGPEVSLNSEQELALYRIVQEALNNARRHAQASLIWVHLCFEPATVRLEVKDDGKGFVVPAALAELAQRGSFGLMGIQERVWSVGGLLTIRSLPNRGTQLNVTVPRTIEQGGAED